MKKFLIIPAFILSVSLAAMAGTVRHTYHFGNPSVSKSGDYQMFNFENTMLTALPGQPVVPYRQVNLMLPPGESATGIEIIFEDEIFLSGTFKLYPQQEVRPVSFGSSGNFLIDQSVYSRNANYPADPKGQLVTAFLNGRSFALSTFTPVKYNPVTGKVSYFATAHVLVRTAADAKAKAALANLSTTNQQALHLAENAEMNQQYHSTRQALTDNYELLIISTTAFSNSFGNLRAGYLKEGLRSQVVTMESIASSMTGIDNPEKIRNYIIQEYQAHGVQYVLLAGDDELIPHRGFYCYVISGSGYSDQNIPADLYYSALDGNWNTDNDAFWGEPGEDDLLPDIAVARMPFSTMPELNSMLNKSYSYQFTPVAGEFRNVLMAGENLWSSPDTWGSDYLELLKGEHSDNGYTTIGIPTDFAYDYLYDETTYWSGQDLMDHLNQGRPMLNHSGHANETYVMKLGNSDITNQNFSGLNGATHNYTVVYTHGCLCGAFDYSDCIAEKMVTINNFAAAFVGNSRYGWFNEGQTEGPSAHLHREFFDALYTDSLNRIGRTHMESKIATASWVTAPGQWEPGALRWCFYDCNVLGDPAFAVYTDNPITINASFPASLVIGTASMNINVTSGGSPAVGLTCVAMKNGEMIGKAVTDISGIAEIQFDPLVNDPGDAQLIVSGYNCLPTTYGFSFTPAAGSYVVYALNFVNDPSGNQNNQPDFGETILLTTGMRNVGGANASNVWVTLSSSDPYVSISDSTELYTLIAAGDTAIIPNAFTFSIAENIPDEHQVLFNVKAVAGTVWFSDFTMTCNAPALAAGTLLIDDATGGNGNGRLDPGESINLLIPSSNIGHSTCLNTTGTLVTTSPWITITNQTVQVGTLAGGESANAIFAVEVSNQAPEGDIAELEFLLSSGEYQANASYYPAISLIVEDFETGNFSKFPWMPIGLYPWVISTQSPFEGIYSSKSADIGDNQSSVMSIRLKLLNADSISFYSKVSSEETFDFLQFFVDMQKMEEWSGTVPWQRHSYAVPAGDHIFKWLYSKDSYTSSEDDCAWVDFIVFPSYTDNTGNKELVKDNPEMIMYPNPATDMMLVEVSLNKICNYSLRLYDAEGKTVFSTIGKSTSEGIVSEKLDVSLLAPGYYTCEMKTDKLSVSRGFIVK